MCFFPKYPCMKFELDGLVTEFAKLEEQLAQPEVYSDQKKMRELMQKRKQMSLPVEIYTTYKTTYTWLEEAKELLTTESDEEMKNMMKEEINELEKQIPTLEEKLQLALLPQDPNDDKNIMLEVRAGAWGDEAALFAWELINSYQIFAKNEWFGIELVSETKSDVGGIKEMILKVTWAGAYSRLKYESWTHRVQRIPATESKWRVHTSAVTVAILPEADEIDIVIRDEDLEITTTRASWAWGQHVNKTDSAIRMVHIPSWIVVECQDGRSQLQNKNKAFQILRNRVYQMELEKQSAEVWAARLAQVGSWDRSEKIRTYNYPQDRVTDHRIKQSFSNLPGIMMGSFTDIINALAAADKTAQLEAAARGDI